MPKKALDDAGIVDEREPAASQVAGSSRPRGATGGRAKRLPPAGQPRERVYDRSGVVGDRAYPPAIAPTIMKG